MRTGVFGVILAGLGLVASTAGCGPQAAGADGAGNALAAAVSHTTAQTARVAITASMGVQGATFSFTETGVFDFAHSRGMLSMRSPVRTTEVLVLSKMYTRISNADSGLNLPKGKSWLVVGNANSGMDTAISPFGAASGAGDPADLLASLTAISGGEKKLGTTAIRGVPVTEYQVNVDPAKAAARLPSAERAVFTTLFGSGEIPVHVWVDSKNLLRRVQVTLNPPGAAAGSLASASPSDLPSGAVSAGPGFSAKNYKASVTADYYDFGVPVHVSAPPAAQVASRPSLPPDWPVPSAKAPKGD